MGDRSITRDVNWGVPVPKNIDPSMEGKTFYVWHESLVAYFFYKSLP